MEIRKKCLNLFWKDNNVIKGNKCVKKLSGIISGEDMFFQNLFLLWGFGGVGGGGSVPCK